MRYKIFEAQFSIEREDNGRTMVPTYIKWINKKFPGVKAEKYDSAYKFHVGLMLSSKNKNKLKRAIIFLKSYEDWVSSGDIILSEYEN